MAKKKKIAKKATKKSKVNKKFALEDKGKR